MKPWQNVVNNMPAYKYKIGTDKYGKEWLKQIYGITRIPGLSNLLVIDWQVGRHRYIYTPFSFCLHNIL